jgi:hypothetical protein
VLHSHLTIFDFIALIGEDFLKIQFRRYSYWRGFKCFSKHKFQFFTLHYIRFARRRWQFSRYNAGLWAGRSGF